MVAVGYGDEQAAKSVGYTGTAVVATSRRNSGTMKRSPIKEKYRRTGHPGAFWQAYIGTGRQEKNTHQTNIGKIR
jgi:hypothetical protein